MSIGSKGAMPVVKTLKSHYAKARQVMPGGVNSSVRFNHAIGTPFYVSRAKGSRVWDIEDRQFIDMSCAHGAALLGHAHPATERALRKAAKLGYAHSFETEYHEQLARELCELIPCADRIRFCSSGTEATLHLIRACRAFTGRDKIIRVEGHFHGYHELIYIGGQPPAAAFAGNRSHPFVESPGIPAAFADFIIPVPFNDVPAMARAIAEHGHEAAVVILEPINFNSGGIMPQPGYLEAVRQLTQDAGIVLFFDEIQSAFKKSPGGAQAEWGVTPDVCTIGKAIGGRAAAVGVLRAGGDHGSVSTRGTRAAQRHVQRASHPGLVRARLSTGGRQTGFLRAAAETGKGFPHRHGPNHPGA